MKRLMAILVALMMTPAAMAADASCEQISALAEQVMENHQNGVPMSKTMAASGGNQLVRAMVTKAYAEPRYMTDQMQRRAVAEYRDNWHLACIKWKEGEQ